MGNCKRGLGRNGRVVMTPRYACLSGGTRSCFCSTSRCICSTFMAVTTSDGTSSVGTNISISNAGVATRGTYGLAIIIGCIGTVNRMGGTRGMRMHFCSKCVTPRVRSFTLTTAARRAMASTGGRARLMSFSACFTGCTGSRTDHVL